MSLKVLENGVVRDATAEESAAAAISLADRTQTASARVRELRNTLLSATDWSQAADVPQATKDKWAPYRQALRDVPQQPGFPENIQWPAKPE